MFIVVETPLVSDPSQVFFGQSLKLTCGPPPTMFDFSPDWSAEWRRDGILISEDNEHIFSKHNGTAELTVLRFFRTDEGKQIFQCLAVKKYFLFLNQGGHLGITNNWLLTRTLIE